MPHPPHAITNVTVDGCAEESAVALCMDVEVRAEGFVPSHFVPLLPHTVAVKDVEVTVDGKDAAATGAHFLPRSGRHTLLVEQPGRYRVQMKFATRYTSNVKQGVDIPCLESCNTVLNFEVPNQAVNLTVNPQLSHAQEDSKITARVAPTPCISVTRTRDETEPLPTPHSIIGREDTDETSKSVSERDVKVKEMVVTSSQDVQHTIGGGVGAPRELRVPLKRGAPSDGDGGERPAKRLRGVAVVPGDVAMSVDDPFDGFSDDAGEDGLLRLRTRNESSSQGLSASPMTPASSQPPSSPTPPSPPSPPAVPLDFDSEMYRGTVLYNEAFGRLEGDVVPVPVKDAAGRMWKGKVPAPDLAGDPKWGFNRYDPYGQEEEARPELHNSFVTRMSKAKENGSSTLLWDIPTLIADILGWAVINPFRNASWGLSVGRPACRLPARYTGLGAFAIPDNNHDPEAPLPPGWSTDPSKRLRPEQLRVLHWMMQRELHPVTVDVDTTLRIEPPFQVDVTLQYSVRGGVLADRIGHGKTATLLGLLASHSPSALGTGAGDPFALSRAEKEQYFDLSRTTLVITPSHLLDQWRGEVQKFLGKGVAVLVVKHINSLKERTVKDLQKYDVIIMSYRMLDSTEYEARLQELADSLPGLFMQGQHDSFEVRRQGAYSTGDMYLRWVAGEAAQQEPPFINAKPPRWEEQFSRNSSSGGGDRGTTRDFFGLAKRTKDFLAPGGVCAEEFHSWHKKSEVLCTVHRTELEEPESLRFPVLQQCLWRRVVLDEFHEAEAEAEAKRKKQVAALLRLQSRTRWGLTGTPNVHSCERVNSTASLLQVDLLVDSEYFLSRKEHEHSERDGAQCQAFVSTFIRQNAVSADIAAIKTVYHEVPVTLSRAEHLLYVQQRAFAKHAHANEEFRRTQLVMLCSHFDRNANLGVASQLVRLREAFTNAVDTARVQGMLALEILRRSDAEGLSPGTAYALPRTGAGAQLHYNKDAKWFSQQAQEAFLAMSTSKCEELRSCFQLLRAHQQRLTRISGKVLADSWQALAEVRKMTQGWEVGNPCNFWLRDEQDEGLRLQVMDVARRVICAVVDTHRQYYFFCLRAFEATDAEEQECPVCMETQAEGLQAWSILPCGHIFCRSCMKSLKDCCPTCRAQFKPEDAFDVGSQSKCLQRKDTITRDFCAEAQKEAQDWSKYGSKIQAICETLQQVKRADPLAKVIVFCQWKSLQDKIAHAFQQYKFRFSQLQGTDRMQSRVVGSFQNNDDGSLAPEILLLNLEVAASGANCTAASYVFFVHPFNAPDVGKAAAYELQAIGRVRRLGQPRKEIHVYRFVTSDTVERAMSSSLTIYRTHMS